MARKRKKTTGWVDTTAGDSPKEWFALVGPLPPMRYAPSSPLNQCPDIIHAARDLWEVNYLDRYECERHCERIRGVPFHPVSADPPEYPIERCLSAMTFFRARESIHQHSTI